MSASQRAVDAPTRSPALYALPAAGRSAASLHAARAEAAARRESLDREFAAACTVFATFMSVAFAMPFI